MHSMGLEPGPHSPNVPVDQRPMAIWNPSHIGALYWITNGNNGEN